MAQSYLVNVGLSGMSSAYTLINTAFEASVQTSAEPDFIGSTSKFTFLLKEGTNVRDHFSGNFCNTLTNTSGTASFGPDRLGMQSVGLPAAFAPAVFAPAVFAPAAFAPAAFANDTLESMSSRATVKVGTNVATGPSRFAGSAAGARFSGGNGSGANHSCSQPQPHRRHHL